MKQYSSILIIAGIFLFVLLLLSNSLFITLQPGDKGVMFRKFSTGLDKENIFGAGFHVVAPWNEMFVYDVKEQKVEESMDILDKNGLSIQIDVTVRFNPNYFKIGELHEKFGNQYIEKLVKPEIRSSVRKVMGRYTAEGIYSTQRAEVEEDIIRETGEVLKANSIEMKTLLIRSIILPERIRKAIDDKEEQKQIAEAYQYRLQKEESEKLRKIIAAKADSAANAIVNSSLSDKLLQMRGIEATIKLSTSENAKTIVIGGGKNGLPLILNDK